MPYTLSRENILSWGFAGILATLGILNVILIHPVPGLIYLLVASIFVPSTNTFLRDRFNLSIPLVVKILVFLLVMWVTLGVSDLIELFEASLLS